MFIKSYVINKNLSLPPSLLQRMKKTSKVNSDRIWTTGPIRNRERRDEEKLQISFISLAQMFN